MIDKTNWAIIKVGALTASGQDEIHCTARTKADIIQIARLFKLSAKEYTIVRLNYPSGGPRS